MSTAVYKCAACDSVLEVEEVGGVTCVHPCGCREEPLHMDLRNMITPLSREEITAYQHRFKHGEAK